MTKWTLCIAIVLCLGAVAHNTSAKELMLDDIFPTDRVMDVQITVSQRDWDTIRYQSRDFMSALNEKRQFGPLDHPYTYVEASVSIDGVVFPQVGIRKKRFIGSQSHTRPSLKIKLNHIDKEGGIEGLTNLTLNNNKQDISQVSQFMGYALFKSTSSPMASSVTLSSARTLIKAMIFSLPSASSPRLCSKLCSHSSLKSTTVPS